MPSSSSLSLSLSLSTVANEVLLVLPSLIPLLDTPRVPLITLLTIPTHSKAYYFDFPLVFSDFIPVL